MYSNFKYENIDLDKILLDDRNPRIVTQKKLTDQQEILDYLVDHGDVVEFTKKIAAEGRNPGGERPYVVKKGNAYVVSEGNTRIAAYKILTGLAKPSPSSVFSFSPLSAEAQAILLKVDCTVAPTRDSLMPIIARAHFGLGDKSKWSYLGNRKALYDEWRAKKSIPALAKTFERSEGAIREYIIEYMLYIQALDYSWTEAELAILTDPSVEFNPPVRFLQTSSHKGKVGVAYDMTNLKISFTGPESLSKYQHLLRKLVVQPVRGLGATASYDEVFVDYKPPAAKSAKHKNEQEEKKSEEQKGNNSESGRADPESAPKPKAGVLFTYSDKGKDALIAQLMVEARGLNCRKFPSAGTFLLRNIVEAILKQEIHAQNANPQNNLLDLEKSLNLIATRTFRYAIDDKKILKEFQNKHLSYLNLGAHGTIIPNYDMLIAARDCVDQFVKRNI